MTFVLPLDLYTILVEMLAGNFQIFFILALFSIAIMGAAFRMSGILILILTGVFVGMIALGAGDFGGTEAIAVLLIMISLMIMVITSALMDKFGR